MRSPPPTAAPPRPDAAGAGAPGAGAACDRTNATRVSVGERADDEVASADSGATTPGRGRSRSAWRGCGLRPDERDARSVRRQRDARFRLRCRPHCGRLAAAERDLPEITLAGEIHAPAVGAPEQSRALAVGEPGQRARTSASRRRRGVQVSDKNVGDAGALRQKGDVPSVGRPDRARRMADVDQLLDRQPARIRRLRPLGRQHDEHRDRQSHGDGEEGFHNGAVYDATMEPHQSERLQSNFSNRYGLVEKFTRKGDRRDPRFGKVCGRRNEASPQDRRVTIRRRANLRYPIFPSGSWLRDRPEDATANPKSFRLRRKAL